MRDLVVLLHALLHPDTILVIRKNDSSASNAFSRTLDRDWDLLLPRLGLVADFSYSYSETVFS